MNVIYDSCAFDHGPAPMDHSRHYVTYEVMLELIKGTRRQEILTNGVRRWQGISLGSTRPSKHTIESERLRRGTAMSDGSRFINVVHAFSALLEKIQACEAAPSVQEILAEAGDLEGSRECVSLDSYACAWTEAVMESKEARGLLKPKQLGFDTIVEMAYQSGLAAISDWKGRGGIIGLGQELRDMSNGPLEFWIGAAVNVRNMYWHMDGGYDSVRKNSRKMAAENYDVIWCANAMRFDMAITSDRRNARLVSTLNHIGLRAFDNWRMVRSVLLTKMNRIPNGSKEFTNVPWSRIARLVGDHGDRGIPQPFDPDVYPK